MALWDTPLPSTPLPLSRDVLIQRISTALADNNVQGISAEDVRSRLIEIAASAANLADGEVDGGGGTGSGYLPLAGGTMTGPLVLAGDPAAPLEAAARQYVDRRAPLDSPAFTGTPTAPTPDPGDNSSAVANAAFVAVALASYLPLGGGVLAGQLTLAGDPTDPLDAATRQYVDNAVASAPAAYLPLAGGTMTGSLLLAHSPSFANEATSKAYVDAGLAAKAPLVSPSFTGIPTGPTASPLTATDQLATTLFVTTMSLLKADLAGAAFTGPVALAADPLNAQEAATKNYVDVAIAGVTPATGYLPLTGGTLTGALTLAGNPTVALHATPRQYVDAADLLRAPLASPAFTGTPTAPTAAPGTNTTQLATTAFAAALGALKASLAGAAFTGAVTAPSLTADAGSIIVDRSGDAATAQLMLRTDAGQASGVLFGTTTLNRWQLSKTAVAEAGSNAGSNLALIAYDDAGGSLGSVFDVTRSSRLLNFLVTPTAPTATAGDATTKLATTAFVGNAVAGATAGGVPTGGTVNQVLAKLSATNYDMGWVNPAGVGTFLALTGGTMTGTLTLAGNPASALQAATMGYVDAADALKAPLVSPTFTGTPAAPTAGTRISTTQLATTAFVNNFYLPLSGGSVTGAIVLPADPTSNLQAATKQYVDGLTGGSFLPLAGGTMSGDIVLAGLPTLAAHATSKSYVDSASSGKAPLNSPAFTGVPTAPTPTTRVVTDQIATANFVSDFYLPLSGGTLTGTLSLSAAPTSSLHATSKAYVDAIDALKAPLASPTFTGTPNAPTAIPSTNGLQIANTAYVTAAGNLKANLASPTFTGVPAAPTAAPGTSTTQLATTAFVAAAATLKANLASPALTGTPTAPTAAAGTSTTQLATTAFVTTADNLKANLANPTFTGVPAGPTAALGTNTTQLATTAFAAAGLALKANLTGAAFSGNISTTGTLDVSGSLAARAGIVITRVGDAAAATLDLYADAGQLAQLTLRTGTSTRWVLRKDNTAESGANAGSDFQLYAYDDAGASLGNVFAVIRASRIMAFSVSPTVPNITAGDASSKVANTAFVAAAVAAGTTGGLPTGGAVNQILAKLSATNYDVGWVNPAGIGTFLPLTGGTLTGPLTLSNNPTVAAHAANKAYVDAADALKANLNSPTFTGAPNAPTPGATSNSTVLATTEFVTRAGDLKAPLTSPNFAGTPTAQTAAPGTNTTQLANTAFVTAALVAKANLASPAFTGTPTAQTAAPGTSSTQLATTAFAAAALALKANLVSPVFSGSPETTTPSDSLSNTTRIPTTAWVHGFVGDKLNWVFPEEFGAADGTAVGDTAAVQGMFNYLAANGGRGLLRRWYNVNAQISVSATLKPFVVEGVGMYICGIRRSSSANRGALVNITGDYITLRNFGIDGNKRTYGQLTHGLNIYDTDYSLLEDLWVTDFSSSGIILQSTDSAPPDTGYDIGNAIRNCHVNGGSGTADHTTGDGRYDATEGGANGISMVGNKYSYAEGCLVQNIHSRTPCIALQFKSSDSCRYSNCTVRNSLIGAATQGDIHPNNCIFEDITIAQPNAAYYNVTGTEEEWDDVSPPCGVRISFGFNISAVGIQIDGNDLAEFRGILIDDDGDGASYVSASVMNFNGANSWPLRLDSRSALVELVNIHNCKTQFILFDPGAQFNTVRLGRLHDVASMKILAPYKRAVDNSGQMSNIVEMLGGIPQKVIHLSDDEIYYVNIDDGSTSGTVEVATNGGDEHFYGWIKAGSSPFIQPLNALQVDIATGIGTLSGGASGGGVDGKLNIYVADGRLTVKNRRGGGRDVSVRLNMFN